MCSSESITGVSYNIVNQNQLSQIRCQSIYSLEHPPYRMVTRPPTSQLQPIHGLLISPPDLLNNQSMTSMTTPISPSRFTIKGFELAIFLIVAPQGPYLIMFLETGGPFAPHLLAQVCPQRLAQPHCCGRLALPERSWGDSSHNNIVAIRLALQLLSDIDEHLCSKRGSVTRHPGDITFIDGILLMQSLAQMEGGSWRQNSCPCAYSICRARESSSQQLIRPR